MRLSKNKTMSLVMVGVILVLYNVVVFVIPFIRGGGFWTGYGFSMLALLLAVSVGQYLFDREGLKSKIYGLPLVSVIWRYLVVQLIVGVLEMALPMVPFQYEIALNVILLGACIIGLIAVDISADEIERIDEKVKEKVFYIKSLQVDIECLADRVADEPAKKLLKDVAETIRYSDPMSGPQLATIENKIEAKVSVLTDAVEKADIDSISLLCNELQQLFSERNQKCKILK
jgi:hypothetical protein